ncbi:hypothetical protein STEG23_025390, partial [Scotinomys teguina]
MSEFELQRRRVEKKDGEVRRIILYSFYTPTTDPPLILRPALPPAFLHLYPLPIPCSKR